MIRVSAGPETPIYVVALGRHVNRLITFVSIAETPTTARLTTAVVVRDHIVNSVHWVRADTDPAHRRNLSTWRTRVNRTTAAATQVTVNCAMSPIVAGQRIAFLCGLRTRRMTAPDRQYW